MTTMKTLVCEQPTKLVYQRRLVPIPAAQEVVIKIITVGICGTDIHAWSGHQPFFSYPRVLGHEICGEIVSVGNNTTDWQVGQRVAVMPYISCHRCGACQSGKTNCCENISVMGVHQDGGFCEYLSVPIGNLLAVDDVAPEAAALIEPFAISAHAVRRAGIAADDQLLVVGAGPIGLGVAAIAKADGAQVVVADTSAERRRHVEQVLQLPTLDPQDERFKGDLQFSDPEFHKKETTLMGSRNATSEDFAKVGRLMAAGKITAQMMLSHHFDFDSLAEHYEAQVINNKQLIKGVIHFQ